MSDSRERFEAWINADCNAHFAKDEAQAWLLFRPIAHHRMKFGKPQKPPLSGGALSYAKGCGLLMTKSAQSFPRRSVWLNPPSLKRHFKRTCNPCLHVERMMMERTQTPRTDEAAAGFARMLVSPEKGEWTELVDSNFARQLERELQEARKDALRWHDKAHAVYGVAHRAVSYVAMANYASREREAYAMIDAAMSPPAAD